MTAESREARASGRRRRPRPPDRLSATRPEPDATRHEWTYPMMRHNPGHDDSTVFSSWSCSHRSAVRRMMSTAWMVSVALAGVATGLLAGAPASETRSPKQVTAAQSRRRQGSAQRQHAAREGAAAARRRRPEDDRQRQARRRHGEHRQGARHRSETVRRAARQGHRPRHQGRLSGRPQIPRRRQLRRERRRARSGVHRDRGLLRVRRRCRERRALLSAAVRSLHQRVTHRHGGRDRQRARARVSGDRRHQEGRAVVH